MDAYTDLLDISNGTRAMTRDNGYVSNSNLKAIIGLAKML